MKQTEREQLIGYLELLGFIKNHTASCFDVKHCFFNEISRLGLVLYRRFDCQRHSCSKMRQNVNCCGEDLTTSLKVTMLSDLVNRGDSLQFAT